jgi:hypothetical protein
MTNHSTGDSVPAAGVVPLRPDTQPDFDRLDSMPGAGGKELVRGSRGQSPLNAREASLGLRSEAEQAPSLDPIQINRNRELGRGKHCGRFTVRGQAPGSPETSFHRVNCKCWNCSYCAPRKAKRIKHAIRTTAEAMQLRRFLTLTLDPAKIAGDPVRYLNAVFAKLRVYLQRKYGVAPQYIRILEFQKNGNPHFHILIDRYIAREWIQAAWVAVGGGWMVDIRHVDVHRVSRYLSKYLTKELLMSAPLRSRRVTTSRGIKMLEKTPTETVWTLVKVPISRLFEVYASDVSSFSLDDDQVLESFTAIFNGN